MPEIRIHRAELPDGQAADLPGLRSIVSGHPTIVLEPVDSESVWSDMAGSSRTMTRKAVNHGYTGAVRQATAEDLSPLGDFRILYEQTMKRLDAAPRYFSADAYYGGLLDEMGPDLLIAEVRDPEGAVVSVALLMRHGDRLHYHLAGSTLGDMRMGASNLLLWTATKYAADPHTEIRAKEIDATTDELSSADYFPAYRGETANV